jgi:hypothetical protein
METAIGHVDKDKASRMFAHYLVAKFLLQNMNTLREVHHGYCAIMLTCNLSKVPAMPNSLARLGAPFPVALQWHFATYIRGAAVCYI